MKLGSFKNSAPEYVVKGNNKMLLGDFKGAILEYTKAIMIDPQFPYSYTSRGAAKMELHDYEGVINDCLYALRLHFSLEVESEKKALLKGFKKNSDPNPAYSKIYSMIGTAKLLLGNREEALLDLNSARLLGNTDAYDIMKTYSKY
ncbi:MAG TPA: tetratricopeptide repeat protein [Ignavibacteriaceae bacterium]|nr:tetratricopeptide repeat protein [Ignavibacteriaceae bacterium]